MVLGVNSITVKQGTQNKPIKMRIRASRVIYFVDHRLLRLLIFNMVEASA